jgi:hypothetical protein
MGYCPLTFTPKNGFDECIYHDCMWWSTDRQTCARAAGAPRHTEKTEIFTAYTGKQQLAPHIHIAYTDSARASGVGVCALDAPETRLGMQVGRYDVARLIAVLKELQAPHISAEHVTLYLSDLQPGTLILRASQQNSGPRREVGIVAPVIIEEGV